MLLLLTVEPQGPRVINAVVSLRCQKLLMLTIGWWAHNWRVHGKMKHIFFQNFLISYYWTENSCGFCWSDCKCNANVGSFCGSFSILLTISQWKQRNFRSRASVACGKALTLKWVCSMTSRWISCSLRTRLVLLSYMFIILFHSMLYYFSSVLFVHFE